MTGMSFQCFSIHFSRYYLYTQFRNYFLIQCRSIGFAAGKCDVDRRYFCSCDKLHETALFKCPTNAPENGFSHSSNAPLTSFLFPFHTFVLVVHTIFFLLNWINEMKCDFPVGLTSNKLIYKNISVASSLDLCNWGPNCPQAPCICLHEV